ncbi:hypothetical protein EJB05_16965 [Eragrostis curvula]|uniref:WRKY domain-containing protein n=1 Tax=Eragrostis curvula TaxID=38414 RepID=A0A5J9VHK9_9POAL|nr:hypothetical protein EJB05_16965 [Eragrostis curvula]
MSSAEDGYCSADSPRADSADEQMAAAEESPRAGAGQNKRERDIPSPSSPLPAAKRSRRSVEKRVVSVPIGECGDRAKGASGEGPPPADSWAWRKYGQKPIKGSPYPRPAAPKPEPVVEEAEIGPEHVAAEPVVPKPEPEPEPEQEEKVAVTLAEQAQVTTVAPAAEEEEESFDFGWFEQYPTTWHKTALYASAPAVDAAPLLPPEEWERELQGEDALFAGLGELPECAVVFGRRRELSVAAATTAPCS